MMFILGDHLGPYHMMVLYHWTIVDVLDRQGGYISLDAHPMTMELVFF